MRKKKKAALSQVEYLQKKLNKIDQQIASAEYKKELNEKEIRDLFFLKGKVYADMELMKRVPHYD